MRRKLVSLGSRHGRYMRFNFIQVGFTKTENAARIVRLVSDSFRSSTLRFRSSHKVIKVSFCNGFFSQCNELHFSSFVWFASLELTDVNAKMQICLQIELILDRLHSSVWLNDECLIPNTALHSRTHQMSNQHARDGGKETACDHDSRSCDVRSVEMLGRGHSTTCFQFRQRNAMLNSISLHNSTRWHSISTRFLPYRNDMRTYFAPR